MAALAAAAVATMWVAQADAVSQGQNLARQAIQAEDAGHFAEAADLFRQALALRPNHPGLTLRLARASAGAGRHDDAMQALEDYAAMGLNADLDRPDWHTLSGHPRWRTLSQRFADNAKPVGEPTLAATIDEPELLAEGIAFDPSTGRVFVAGVHKRKIVKIAPDGKVSTFVDQAAHGLLGAFGLAFHSPTDTLWAASSGVPQAGALTAAEKGQTGIFAFDMGGGLTRRVLLPADGKDYAFGDLAVATNGDVFTSDSYGPSIYRLTHGGEQLEAFLTSDEFHAPQGVALSADESKIAIADYSNGIHIADRASRTRIVLPMPPRTTLHGVDGLVRHGRDLIAVQNGIDPQRVIRIRLSATWTAIEGVDVLAANLPEMDEPTLATLAAGGLLVIGNGQWSRFNDDGTVKGDQPFAPTRILRFRLPPARP